MTSQALFTDEHTSCDRWFKLQKKKHLLECFAFESTRAPDHLRSRAHEPKYQSEAGIRQAQRRAELVKALNNLIGEPMPKVLFPTKKLIYSRNMVIIHILVPYLRGGYLGKGDAHPKTPNLRESFHKKEFRGDVKLNFQLSPDSLVTDGMLAKGSSALTNNEVNIWLDDIHKGRYTVIRIPNKSERSSRSSSPQLSKPAQAGHVDPKTHDSKAREIPVPDFSKEESVLMMI